MRRTSRSSGVGAAVSYGWTAAPPPGLGWLLGHAVGGDLGAYVEVSDCVSRLAALVGVPDRKRNRLDWRAIEASLGTRLPEDYKRLVDTFPDGIFQGLARVNRPGDHHQSDKEFLGFYAYQLEDMRALRSDGHSFPYPMFPEPGGLLPWATGPRREPFFWVTQAEDPNAWPVVTADYGFTEWREFSGPACQFLIEVVEGRFDGSIFGVDLAARGPWFQPIDDEELAPSSSAGRPSMSHTGRAANELSALVEVVGPAPGTAHPVDWAEVQEFMGVSLPEDYRSFIDMYGPGTFGEITITVPGGPAELDMYQLLARAIAAARAPDAIRSVPICPEPDGIIAWGETADGWTFSWAPTDPDPDRWGVVASSRELVAHLPDRSFSQFLGLYADGDREIADVLGRNTPLLAPPRFTPYGSARSDQTLKE